MHYSNMPDVLYITEAMINTTIYDGIQFNLEILNRHHRSCGDCLEGKGENYQVCSVQYCVQQLCTV